MESEPGQASKPERLYFKTYLELLKNSVGTEMFRSIFVQTPERGEFDALDGGKNSCAFFVSAVLVLFKKSESIHGTVESTRRDLENFGWQLVDGEMQEGDVLVWEAMPFEDGTYEHIGFYVGDDKAVSTSWTELKVVRHDAHFGDADRAITHVYRMNNW